MEEIILSTPQQWFMESKAKMTLWVGSRGSSKTFVGLFKSIMLCMTLPHYRCMIFKKNYTEFVDVLEQSREMNRKMFGGVLDIPGSSPENGGRKTIVFPNGSFIFFGAADSIASVAKHQGNNYHRIWIDEAQNILVEVLERIVAIARNKVGDYPAHIDFTANPGGIGFMYLKRHFIELAEKISLVGNVPEHRDDKLGFFQWNIKTRMENPITGNTTFLTKTILKTSMSANPVLDKDAYVASLGTLSESLKRMWLYGDWSVSEGQFFDNIEKTHAPVTVGENDFLMRFIDPGYAHTAVIWCAVTADGKYKVFDCENYEQQTIDEIAPKILARYPHLNFRLDIIDVAASTQTSQTSEGKPTTIVDIYNKHGIYPVSKKSSRIHGWQLIREKIHENLLKIHPVKGRHLLESLATLQIDPNDPEDCIKQKYDHLSDALRYGIVFAEFNGYEEQTEEQEYLDLMLNDPDVVRLLNSRYRSY